MRKFDLTHRALFGWLSEKKTRSNHTTNQFSQSEAKVIRVWSCIWFYFPISNASKDSTRHRLREKFLVLFLIGWACWQTRVVQFKSVANAKPKQSHDYFRQSSENGSTVSRDSMRKVVIMRKSYLRTFSFVRKFCDYGPRSFLRKTQGNLY